ncbi:MAG: pyruvate kinase, partial [Clostridia bacterium]|nr:pyruvate kinase [Clostridia bacterium]
MRKTKIVCTIGPASSTEEVLTNMCLAVMNVARLNFSHGTHDDHKEKIEMIKRIREKLGLPIAILLDTKGPEYRIKTFENGSVMLCEGDEFSFTANDVVGNEHEVSVSYPQMVEELDVGDRILLNNGLLSFTVIRKEP